MNNLFILIIIIILIFIHIILTIINKKNINKVKSLLYSVKKQENIMTKEEYRKQIIEKEVIQMQNAFPHLTMEIILEIIIDKHREIYNKLKD